VELGWTYGWISEDQIATRKNGRKSIGLEKFALQEAMTKSVHKECYSLRHAEIV
jgi:hypothetical protein